MSGELSAEQKQNALLYAAVPELIHREIRELLEKEGFTNTIMLDSRIEADIMGRYFDREGLFRSIPRLNSKPNERLESIPGAVPHPLDLPKGCKFAPRCKYATEKCLQEEPKLVRVNDNQQIRCFYPDMEVRHG